ncbi:hypothetical protein BDV59DRAFT_183346 [Aspergillus ambiguus]|uniref:uncharacterized protein n=1 Tax=Aspergillus ambiguus TaxID=176160 RepID=UPI003CCCD9E4
MALPACHKVATLLEGKEPRFEVIEAKLPDIGPTDLLIKLSATGVCGTDVGLASGKLGPCRRILGHEGIGRVVNRGAALPESSVAIGQRVGVSWVRDTCGDCPMCLHDGGEIRCQKQVHSGRVVDGTFAEYTVVPFRHMIRLPQGPSDEHLAPIMCAGVTAYKALKECGAVPGQWVVISGAGGGVGSLGIQYACAMGYRVLATDAGEQKREYCLRLGAEAYLDVTKEEDIAAGVMSATDNQGAGAVVVAAGAVQAYQDALGMLAPFGTLVCVGIPPPSLSVHFHPLLFIDRGIRVIGSMVGSKGDIADAVRFVQRKAVVPDVEVTTLDRLSDIMQQLALQQSTTKYVIKL